MAVKPRLHKASLLDPNLHSPALLRLIEQPVSKPVVDYLVAIVTEMVDHASGRRKRGETILGRKHTNPSSFSSLVNTILTRVEADMAIILVTLAYLDRVKSHLCIGLSHWVHERVFLGALMVASKYANDSTLRNVHWALCSGTFCVRDVGQIEREFLALLNWNLSITEEDVLAHHEQLFLRIPALKRITTPSPVTTPLLVPQLLETPTSPSVMALSPSIGPDTPSPQMPVTPMDADRHMTVRVVVDKHSPQVDIDRDSGSDYALDTSSTLSSPNVFNGNAVKASAHSNTIKKGYEGVRALRRSFVFPFGFHIRQSTQLQIPTV